MLNVYSRDLDVPSLFDRERISDPRRTATIQFKPKRPLLTTPSYVIDLNVFFDAVRNRDKGQCDRILSSALKHQISLVVTLEFVQELLRHSNDRRNDPILTFARSLPTLRPIESALLQPLIDDLKKLVFPASSGPRHSTVNDRSDLIHLAYSVHHGAFGFITRDSAVLRCSAELHEGYGLHVMSPNDFVDTIPEDDGVSHVAATVIGRAQDFTVSVVTDHNRATVRDFVLSHDAAKRDIHSWLDPSATQSRPDPVVVSSSDRIAGVGLWSAFPGPGRDAALHIYVDEIDPAASRAIDHILECGAAMGPRDRAWRFNLLIPRQQIRTRETALRRGFHSQHEPSSHASFELSRVVIRGVIAQATWRNFRRDFLDITALKLAETMPTYEEMTNTGIVLGRGQGIPAVTMSLFDFETFVSPGCVLGRNRGAVIVPIRDSYADELLPSTSKQGMLFARYDSTLRIERAYFLAARKHSYFPPGTLVVFYVSGRRHQAVALARVTFSNTLTKTQAVLNLSRQGVLTEDEIHQQANDRGEVSAFTFDNVMTFPCGIDYWKLKRMGCVNAANLVTAQRISYESLIRIVGKGFEANFG